MLLSIQSFFRNFHSDISSDSCRLWKWSQRFWPEYRNFTPCFNTCSFAPWWQKHLGYIERGRSATCSTLKYGQMKFRDRNLQVIIQNAYAYIRNVMQKYSFIIKPSQKVWNIFKIIYFWSYFEMRCIVLYTIAKRVPFASQCYFICNHGQFCSWDIAFRCWGQEGNVSN